MSTYFVCTYVAQKRAMIPNADGTLFRHDIKLLTDSRHVAISGRRRRPHRLPGRAIHRARHASSTWQAASASLTVGQAPWQVRDRPVLAAFRSDCWHDTELGNGVLATVTAFAGAPGYGSRKCRNRCPEIPCLMFPTAPCVWHVHQQLELSTSSGLLLGTETTITAAMYSDRLMSFV